MTETLKCREGDLARIIFDETRQDVIGLQVSVLYRATPLATQAPDGRWHFVVSKAPCWMVEFSAPVTLWGQGADGSLWQAQSLFAVVQDRCLMPIRPPGDPEQVEDVQELTA